MCTDTYLDNENRRDLRIVNTAMVDLLAVFRPNTPDQKQAYNRAMQVFQDTVRKLESEVVIIEGLNDR